MHPPHHHLTGKYAFSFVRAPTGEMLEKMCPSAKLLRQRSRTNNFNHQKRLDKGQLLGRLVSLRRTKAAEIYRKTGNLRAVQLLLGHTKVDSTVRYLGVEVEDALNIAERIDL
jgi:integrase